MPTPTSRLKIPLPLGNETVSRQAFVDVYNTIDANAATRAEPEVLALDLFAQGFVLSGLQASKDGVTATKLNVTAGVAYVQQAGGGLRRYTPAVTSFTTAATSALYYLDLQPDGTWSWATTHSTQTGYLPVAEVQTDASGNIATVTDRRNLLPGLGPVNADRLDGYHAGHSSGQVPVSDGTVNTSLNADKLDGYDAGHASGQVPVSDGTVNTQLNADLVDGYHVGHASGQVPLSDGTLNTTLNADTVDGAHAGTAAGNVLKLDTNALVPLGNIPATLTGKDADTIDGAHAGTGPNNVLKLDVSGQIPLGSIPATLTGKDADSVDGAHAGTGPNNVLKLDASGQVPLGNIPATLTGKDADSVDGAHAGTAAGNVLKLDGSGLVPLANIPSILTGKDADTLDGQHASYFASAASVGAVARLFADANAKDYVQAATGVSVVADTGAWSGQAVHCDASVTNSAAADVVIFPMSTLRWTEYVIAVRMKTNDAATLNLAVIYFEQFANSAWSIVSQKQIDGTMFTATGDYEVFYLRGHYSAGTQCRVRVYWNKATSTHVLDIDAIVIVPVGATAAV